MKKLKWLVPILVVSMIFGIIACKHSTDPHYHLFSKEWTSDETNHWHASICGHAKEVSGKAAHTFGDWTTTLEATEEAEGSKERSCTVCGYTATEVIAKLPHEHKFADSWTSDETNHWKAATCEHTKEVSEKSAHTFGDWTITKEATEAAAGSKERTCSVCEYKATEEIAKLPHTHKFADSWTSDETYHWYASTCGHTTEVSKKTAHTFGDWTTTKEATEEAEGSKERTCSVCGYKATEVIEKLPHTHKFATVWSKDLENHWYASTCGHDVTDSKAAHTFGEWTTTNEATEDAEGSKERICSVCEYTATEAIEKLPHTHKYANEWTSDDENHWHAATCEHTEEVSEKSVHTFVNEVCTICEYLRTPEGFVMVKGTTITGTESWTPTSSVFVSGRNLTIRNLLVSDHEVTRGEYKTVMGSDQSTADAYDKNGTKLTEDAALNNPVNNVNWYDAIVYCNTLSIKEDLTPCYSINGETDPVKWGTVPTTQQEEPWDVTCNFEANGYRLPTEAEWEWLARGGEDNTYAGSNNIDDVAWYSTNPKGTRDVKTKQPNAYGLYDMSGNVREWCWDWHVSTIDDSTGEYGDASGSSRVMRGGSWYDTNNTRCTVNNHNLKDGPYRRYNDYGFRVVRTLE